MMEQSIAQTKSIAEWQDEIADLKSRLHHVNETALQYQYELRQCKARVAMLERVLEISDEG